MSRAVPQTVAEVLEHFTPLKQEPEIVQRVREEVPTHFFVDDPDARHYAWCSHCGEFVNLGRSRHRTKTICPCCEACGDIIHTWRGYKGLVDRVLVYVYGKSVKSPEDTITARAIYMEYRWGQKDPLGEYALPWNMEPYVAVDSYYVFIYGQGAAQVRPVNNWRCNTDYPLIYDDLTLSKSVNSRSWVYANCAYGAQRHIIIAVDDDSIADAVGSTPFHYVWDVMEKNCGMDDYVNFFARLAKYPFAVETMVKLGRPTARWLYNLTEKGASASGVINWRGKTIKKLFRYSLTKEEKAWLRDAENTEIYCGDIFMVWQWLRKRGNTQITLFAIDALHISTIALIETEKIINPNRLVKYLVRQQANNPDYAITMDLYRDYIRYAKWMDVNLTEKASIMPKNLIEAHDTLMQEYRQIQELRQEEMRMAENRRMKRAAKAKDSLYSKLRRKIARKYAFEADGMMIYVPKKLEELIEEGVAMHSCVGGYVDRVAEGKTIVVFIRSAEDCAERIGTMEISRDGRSIIQARAKFNKNLPPEAAEFVSKFRAAKIDGNGERKTA